MTTTRVVALLSLACACQLLTSVSAESDPAWLTHAEAADFQSTPNYAETLQYIERLAQEWSGIKLESFGLSAAGRRLPVVIVSTDGADTPEQAAAAGKAVVLIQNGIHAGEIDGKDASLILLRDMARGKHRELLDKMTLVIVAIYNVDGHERISQYNRPNQDGPVAGMGFRTTSDGHDLNRDHLKLETPEAQAVVGLFNRWRPHIHVDNHVTNGVDHDWLLTYSWIEAPQAPPPLDAWLKQHMPAVLKATEAAGHRVGPYVSLVERNDPTKGIDSFVGPPRYATGYYPLRNVASLLVENHSPKPYRDRVIANHDFMVALLQEIARDPQALIKSVKDSAAYTTALGRPDAAPSDAVLRFRAVAQGETVLLPIYDWFTTTSTATGATRLGYNVGQVTAIEVPWLHIPEPQVTVPRPRGYFISPGWPVIEQRLAWHGLEFHHLGQARELDVETIRISNPRQGPRSQPSYQGRTRISVDVVRSAERRTLPAGTLWVPADQPDFEVAIQLLEPEAPDSLVSWGMLSSVLEWKEYIDTRVLDPLVTEMLKDPDIAADWKLAMEDENFAADPRARYAWWYQRTPYWDETIGLMPVMRRMQPLPFRPQSGSGQAHRPGPTPGASAE